MTIVMWNLRPENQHFDPATIYEFAPTMFSIEVHHGGRFTKPPNTRYVEGKVGYFDLVDIDEFSVHELDSMVMKLGYSLLPEEQGKIPPLVYYHFRIPERDLDFGLRALGNDADVLNLAKYVGDHKLIEVYIEHGKTNLLTYFMSPHAKPRVVIDEIPEDDNILAIENAVEDENPMGEYMSLILYGSHPNQVSPEYRRHNSVNLEEGQSSCRKKLSLVDLDEEGVEPVDKTTQQNDESIHITDVDIEDFDPFNEDYYFPPMNDHNAIPDEDKDKQPEEDDELIDEHDKERQTQEDDEQVDEHDKEKEPEEEDDDDELVDEENVLEEVEVDMTDFSLNLDTNGNFGQMDEEKEDEVLEEIEVIDNDRWDSMDEGSDDDRKRRSVFKSLAKEKRCSMGTVHKVSFYVGQKFTTKKELKDKIDAHAVESRRNLFFKKNYKLRLRALCKGVVPVTNSSGVVEAGKSKGKDVNTANFCTWSLHASRSNEESDWYIRTFNDNHTCLKSRKIRACTATFLAKEILDQVETNPGVPLRALQEQIQKKYEVGCSMDKAFRAKSVATKVVVGDYSKQYELLRDYCLELQSTNMDTTVKIEVYPAPNPANTTRMFKRIYICLGPLKQGFKAGLRDLLGFDGAFMKGPFPGQVLTAVGLDSNNGIYPLAYAIVETENTCSWTWFLECLGEDLELGTNSNFTFITDRQKGLIPAIAKLYPCAEHRYCLRHIHQNMRKTWKLKEYKQHLWKCASATTVPEFDHYMKEFSLYDKEACEWLRKIPPKHWARSHFTGRAISDMLLNNLCEVFNSKIIDGRDKPIIGCLEYIRQYLMKRICIVMKVMNKATGPLTPTATSILEANKDQASQYIARWNGGEKYQVTGAWQDQHVVDVKNNTCTYRKWELIGIPCKHAIATLNEMTLNSEDVGALYKLVHKAYWLDTWKKAYSFKVEPIKGRIMWPKSLCPTKLCPPPHHNQVGRPKKKRKQSEDESQRGSQTASQSQRGGEAVSQEEGVRVGADGVKKLTRKFVSVTCGKCKNKGHNSRTCKGQGGQ